MTDYRTARRFAWGSGLSLLLWGTLAVAGANDIFVDGFESDAGAPVDDAAAARFLDQALGASTR